MNTQLISILGAADSFQPTATGSDIMIEAAEFAWKIWPDAAHDRNQREDFRLFEKVILTRHIQPTEEWRVAAAELLGRFGGNKYFIARFGNTTEALAVGQHVIINSPFAMARNGSRGTIVETHNDIDTYIIQFSDGTERAFRQGQFKVVL